MISTDFGVGNGSTTFNLPDSRLRFDIGAAAIGGGATGGSLPHTHTTPSHPHTANQPDDHGQHASEGAHTHDSHTTATRAAGASTRLTGPATHSSGGTHQHVAHSAHTGFAVTDGGSGTSTGVNPPFLAFDYIIASFNTHLVSFDVRSDHVVADSLRVRIAHAIRQDHFVSQGGKAVTKRSFDVRSDHFLAFDELLTLTRSFSIRQDHMVSRTLRARLSLEVRSDHFVSLTRSLDATRSFAVRQDHFLSRSLAASVSHSVRSDHVISIDRSLILDRTFSIRSNHILSVDTVKIFVRTFSTRQNHHLSARVCLDWDDLPDPGAGGGTTIVKRLFLFDD